MKKWLGIVLLAAACSSHEGSMAPYWLNCANQSWLTEIKKSIVESGSQGAIYAYQYKGETVFMVEACPQCADSMTSVYACGGQVICLFGGIAGLMTCLDFGSVAINRTLVWRN